MTTNPRECDVCNEKFDENARCPRILPCSHYFCSECIGRLLSLNQKQCPLCRRPFKARSTRDLMINRAVLNFMQYLQPGKRVSEENDSSSKRTRYLESNNPSTSTSQFTFNTGGNQITVVPVNDEGDYRGGNNENARYTQDVLDVEENQYSRVEYDILADEDSGDDGDAHSDRNQEDAHSVDDWSDSNSESSSNRNDHSDNSHHEADNTNGNGYDSHDNSTEIIYDANGDDYDDDNYDLGLNGNDDDNYDHSVSGNGDDNYDHSLSGNGDDNYDHSLDGNGDGNRSSDDNNSGHSNDGSGDGYFSEDNDYNNSNESSNGDDNRSNEDSNSYDYNSDEEEDYDDQQICDKGNAQHDGVCGIS